MGRRTQLWALAWALASALTAGCAPRVAPSPEPSAPPTPVAAETTAAPAATATTSVPSPEQAQNRLPTLHRDGIGDVEFGTPADAALDALTALLGEPEERIGWRPTAPDPSGVQAPWGTCPGTELLGVRWSGLWALFGDDSDWIAEGRHLYAWVLERAEEPAPLAFRTPEGIGLGSPRAELEQAYGAELRFHDTEHDVLPRFSIDIPGLGHVWPRLLAGHLNGHADTDVVAGLRGGHVCGE